LIKPEQAFHVAADLDQHVAGLILRVDCDLRHDPAQSFDCGSIEAPIATLERRREVGDCPGICRSRLRMQLNNIRVCMDMAS
jgi:hypothetical protein